MSIAKFLTISISENIWERLLSYILHKNWMKLFRGQIDLLFHFKIKNHFILLTSFAFIRFITRCHSLSLIVNFCYSLWFVFTRCHTLSAVVTRCHSLYHSLSLVIIRCTTRCQSLSFVVPFVFTRCDSMYHSSVFFLSDHEASRIAPIYQVVRCHNDGDFIGWFIQTWHWIRHYFYKSIGETSPNIF